MSRLHNWITSTREVVDGHDTIEAKNCPPDEHHAEPCGCPPVCRSTMRDITVSSISQEEAEEEDRRAAKAARKKEDTAGTHSMEVEMSDMEAVVQQSTLYDELYRAYMMLREPLD